MTKIKWLTEWRNEYREELPVWIEFKTHTETILATSKSEWTEKRFLYSYDLLLEI